MIVVGGKNSANTKRLAQICEAIQPMTRHIEVASEIDVWIGLMVSDSVGDYRGGLDSILGY